MKRVLMWALTFVFAAGGAALLAARLRGAPTTAAATQPPTVPATVPDVRFPLSPAMLLNETAAPDDVVKLIDEQGSIGGGSVNNSKAPTRAFFAGWQEWTYPVHVAIDLGAVQNVSRVLVWNESGEHDVLLGTGTPFRWKTIPVRLSGYKNWVTAPIGVRTRWLRLTLPRPVRVGEIAVNVVPPIAPAAAPRPVTAARPAKQAPRPFFDQFIGTNGFIDDPRERLAAVAGYLREYHNWSWDEGDNKPGYPGYPNNQNAFSPSAAAGGNGWFFDDYYADLKRRGVSVVPCIQGAPSWIVKDTDDKPVLPGRDPEDPRAYAAHADHLFQFAARYGSRKVSDALLKLAPNQKRVSGLGLLSWLENGNENDKNWKGRSGHFAPYELAALSSADYDGHRGALGKTSGTKNADPQMKMALAGLVEPNLDYLRAMKFWADHNRAGSFPADAINFHHYSNDAGGQIGGQAKAGISPEADRLRERCETVVRWRDANLPGVEVWMTEFGYDTHPAGPQRAPAINGLSAEQVQAAWLVRSLFALYAAGADRAAQFMFRDVDPQNGGRFATSGLVTEKSAWKPKPAYAAFAALKQHLAGLRGTGDVATGRADVRAYRFAGPNGRVAYALWCPTSENKRVAGFALPIGAAKTATLARLEDSDAAGQSSTLTVSGGKVTVAVSEMPVLVLAR